MKAVKSKLPFSGRRGARPAPDPPAVATVDAAESLGELPVVQRYYVNAATGESTGGETSVYAYLASDLYLKHVRNDLKPPRDLMDFRGCEETILLSRLPDGKTSNNVENAVVLDEWKRRSRLRIRGEVRERKEPGGSCAAVPRDIVLLFPASAGSEELCLHWARVLRLRITPLALRRKRVRDCFSEATSLVPSTLLLKEFQNLCRGDTGERASAPEVPEGPEGNVSAAEIGELSEAYIRRLARGREMADLAKSTAEEITNLMYGSDVLDLIARALGGVTLIGPVVSVATLCLNITKLAVQVKVDRDTLEDLHKRVPEIARSLSQTVLKLLIASSSSTRPEIVDGTFAAIENCWLLFNKAERHLLATRQHQVWHTDNVENMKVAAEKLEHCLELSYRDENIADLFARTDAIDEKTAVNTQDIQDVKAAVDSRVESQDQKMTALIAPPAPARVVREAILDYDAIRSSQLSGGTTSLSDVAVSAVNGDGGYGKTTCLLLLARDHMIRDAFRYVFFIPCGPNIQDSGIIRHLMHVARKIGLGILAETIKGVSPGANQVWEAVSLLQDHLENARTLLLLDNVWQRQAGRQWVAELSALVSETNGSSVVVSTRSRDLAAECAVPSRCFTVGRVADESAARRIVEIHAGLEPGAEKPRGMPGCYVSARDKAEHDRVIATMLDLCQGWHLALGMCGARAKLKRYRWADIGESLRRNIVETRPDSATKYVQHPGLQSIVDGNLEAAEVKLKDIGFSCASDRQAFETLNLKTLYSRLSILDASREFPYYCLGPLFGLTESGGEEVGELFEEAGLAKARGNVEQRILWVHDLQHASAELLCQEAGVTLATVHSTFLQSCARHFGIGGESIAAVGPTSWSRICERADAKPDRNNLASFVCCNLVRHVLESNRDGSGAVRIELRQDDSRDWRVESEGLKLVCSYEWIRARGHTFGRAGVVRDFAVLSEALGPGATESYAGVDEDATELRAARSGASSALQTILKVLQRTGLESFNQDTGADSGLAGELYGRLAVLKFKRVDDAAQLYGLQVVGMLQASIRESARPPWLCPRGECYRSVEDNADERCTLEFSTARGGYPVAAAYVQVGDKSLLYCGGSDRTVRILETRLAGDLVRELEGHRGVVSGVVSAGRGTGGADCNVVAASCSWDGTARLWGVDAAAKGEVGEISSLHTPESTCDEALWCLDLTPDAARVVAGGRKGGVYVWTRRRSAGAAAAAPGADAYAAIALPGHKDWVRAVQVSRTGERIVTASEDETVGIWRVAMDAATAGADGLPREVVFTPGRKSNLVDSLALAADGQTLYAGMLFCPGIAIVDCESAREVVALQSDSVSSSVCCVVLLESSGGGGGGGGGSGRLFAGHGDGVISEWDLESRSCSTVYGDPRSHAGRVDCIAARFTTEQGSDGGGAALCASDRALCRAGQKRVEFAAGYLSGLVRVWRARSGYASDENSGRLSGTASAAAKTREGVDESAVGRHADTPYDYPVCLASSGDGRWLVSGSDRGVLCVWDTDSAACVATLCGHERGKEIRGIDASDHGKVIASCGDDGTARVWTLQGSNEWMLSAVLDHEASAYCVVLTADAFHAITGDGQGNIRVWNTQTSELCWHSRAIHSHRISSLAVMHGETVHTGSTDPRAALRLSSFFLSCLSSFLASCLGRLADKEQCCSEAETIRFASRHYDGTCILWSLCQEDALDRKEGVSDSTDLGSLFSSSNGLGRPRERWHEQQIRKDDQSERESRRVSVVSKGGSDGMRRYEVSVDGMNTLRLAVERDCDARLCLDSEIAAYESAFICFERGKGEAKRALVCCGLYDGTVAISDLIYGTS